MATFTQLASGNWRVQVRRKTRYVAETFRRRKDGEEWALEMERNIDRNGPSKATRGAEISQLNLIEIYVLGERPAFWLSQDYACRHIS